VKTLAVNMLAAHRLKNNADKGRAFPHRARNTAKKLHHLLTPSVKPLPTKAGSRDFYSLIKKARSFDFKD
jgi:hypothetical protein